MPSSARWPRSGSSRPSDGRRWENDIYHYFTGVFAAGSALAALGGLMWAMFIQSVRPSMGGEQLIFAFIVVIIGGLGSVTGSLLGALIVGLSYNYVAFLVPRRPPCSPGPR